jgi:uncharacterized protein with GYD domain
MRYVLLGNISAAAIGKQKPRTSAARAKLKKLGIKLQSVAYTQGVYDFVDMVEAPNAGAVLAFSIWYARQGYGKITTMPAFDEAAMLAAIKNA